MKNFFNIKLLISLIIIFITYLPLYKNFFQQDAWKSFGNIFALSNSNFIERIIYYLLPRIGHYTPFTLIFSDIFYSLFKLNYYFWFSVSISWHIIIVYLLYLLGLKVFKNNYLSLITALLFGLFSSIHQATSWVIADINTHGSTFFGILSVIFIYKFLENNKKIKNFYLSIIFVFISILFKESTIGLFVLLPFILLFSNINKDLLIKKKAFILGIIGVIYVLVRFSMFLIPSSVEQIAPITEVQKPEVIVYNFLSYPVKSVSQSIVPQNQTLYLSKIITALIPEGIAGKINSLEFDRFVETFTLNTFDFLVFLISLLILFVAFKKGDKKYARIALIGFIWIIVNSFVYFLSPARIDAISVIDSRNLYFTSIGTAIFIVSIIRSFNKKNKNIALFLLPFFIINIYWLNKDINILAKDGSEDKQILQQIKINYPNLNNKTIFYTESDSSFYGLSDTEKIMPFQSGFGQTLLVWYQDVENFSIEFFQDKYLWDIQSQDYQEINGRGFGYFRDFDLMMKAIKANNISENSVIAYSYSSQNKSIKDITEEVRGRIVGFNISKKQLNSKNFLINSSNNPKQIYAAIDGNRNTKWDSKLEYINYQFIEIDLGNIRNITQVRLDSFDNKDQNVVGYRILLSKDNSNWSEVFYSKYYPPNENGLVDIYFKSQPARYLKIEQIGQHPFASWVIHEINIYEVK